MSRLNRLRSLLVALATILAAQPVTAAPITQEALRTCGEGPRGDVCIILDPGAPARFAPIFDKAARVAVDAAYSDALLRDFAAFKSMYGGKPELADAWQGVDPATSIASVREKLRDLHVTTFGGLKAWWQFRFSGNIAWDGAESGPVRLNRYGLGRPFESVAGTLIHETGHRAGLKHPSSGFDLKLARCEPAYVVGSLATKIAVGATWQPGPNDCPHLANLPSR